MILDMRCVMRAWTMLNLFADDEAICLTKAADTIRRDMFGLHTGFDGSFPRGCQEDAVLKSLITLVGMIVDGQSRREMHTT